MNEREVVEIHSDDYLRQSREIIGTAIVCAPTGILCTAQVGGTLCRHPKYEGYTIPLHAFNTGKFLRNLDCFDDCEWGCCLADIKNYSDIQLENITERRNDYAKAIDKFLEESFNNKNVQQIMAYFDYDRIDELTEGWWPVLIQFSEWLTNKPYETKFKGYLHFGNCD